MVTRGTARRCEAILQGIDAKRAAARPIAGGHSIWELVLHMIGWKNETTRRLSGARGAHARRRRLAGDRRGDR